MERVARVLIPGVKYRPKFLMLAMRSLSKFTQLKKVSLVHGMRYLLFRYSIWGYGVDADESGLGLLGEKLMLAR